MQLQTFIKGSLFIALPFWVASCNDDDNGNGPSTDTTPPEITIERPEEGEIRTINQGEEYSHMHFRATITDNEELGELEIDIHDNFDGHDHGKNFSPFTYHNHHDLTGTRDTFVDYDIEINGDAVPGEYHLTVRVTDRAGNSLDIDGADVKNVTFHIENGNFGVQWNVNAPEDHAQFSHGENIDLDIDVHGNGVDVEEIWLNLTHIASGETVYTHHRDHLHADPYNFQRTILVENDWPAGEYNVEVEAELENGKHYHMHPELHIEIVE